VLVLTTAAEDLDRLYPWLEAEAAAVPTPIRHAMHVALEEAVMNVVTHAFAPGDAGRIGVTLDVSGGSATLVIEDSGAAFNPVAAPAPERPTTLEPGGLGLILLRHYCHDIRYERAGERNRLTLRFPL
jgi:anti-sigma regulatory factor (Ser/Thr protein kinase)